MREVLDSPILKSLAGIVVALFVAYLIGMTGWAWGAISERMERIDNMALQTKTRVTKLEVEVIHVREGLSRIEQKLDRALEKK